jgi:hypothetical protein
MSARRAVHPAPATPPPRSDAELAAGGLALFFRIAERWGLTNEQARVLLGEPARATFYRWKRGEVGEVSRDTLERLSHLIGIYQALNTLFTDRASADEWVRQPNTAPLFGGRPALERMLAGGVSDLYVVRQYLAAEAAGASWW